jgi:hypothetical protein
VRKREREREREREKREKNGDAVFGAESASYPRVLACPREKEKKGKGIINGGRSPRAMQRRSFVIRKRHSKTNRVVVARAKNADRHQAAN